MKSKEEPTPNIIEHMRSYHPEISKLYEAKELRKTAAPVATYAVKKSKTNSDDSKANKDSSGNDDVVEIVDEDDVENNTATGELTHQKSMSGAVIKESLMGLSAESLKKLKVMISEKLQNLITTTGFNEVRDEVNKLVKLNAKKETQNASIVEKLKSEIDSLKKECSDLRLAVVQSQASKKQLQNELHKLETRLQQRKLIIKNLKISNTEQPITEIEKLFKENLGLHNVRVLSCNIIPCSNTSTTSGTPNTEIISVELSKAEDCKLVLKQMHKLRNSKVFIEPELTPLQRKRKNKLMVVRRELLSRKSDLKVLVRNTTLVVKGKNFHWDDTDGLCHDISTSPETLQTSGVEYLKSITGLDLTDFLNILQKYDIK